MSKIKAIITSFDRACQLHLLLESLSINAKDVFDIRVIWRASNALHSEAYFKLIKHCAKQNNPISFIRQTKETLEEMFEMIISEVETSDDLVCFFVDDNVMFDDMKEVNEIKKYIKSKNVNSFSLRLGKNIKYDGPKNKESLFQPFFTNLPNKNFTGFSLTGGGTCHFAYPFSVDGHIYRKDLYLSIANKINWKKQTVANAMESAIVEQIYDNFRYWPKYCICYNNSIVTNIVLNRVSNGSETLIGNFEFSPEKLRDFYLNDFVIDFGYIKNEMINNVNQCHVSQSIKLHKIENSLL